MKPTTLNRWLKLIVWLLVIVIIVMLLIPSELTNEQLAQIKPGMTLQEAKQLLGEPIRRRKLSSNLLMTNPADALHVEVELAGAWWHPAVSASVQIKQSRLFALTNETWIGKSHLLLVQAEKDVIIVASMAPITRTGGGIQGCIDSIVESWNDWWK